MSSPTPRCPTVVSESAAIDEKPTFLNIPAEIRLKIYDHIWTNVEYHVEKNKVPWRRSGATRLDLVCKKLRKECAMRMVSEAIFNLAPTAEHRRCRWLTLVATPILYKENIRHIKMADNHFFRLGNQTLKPLTMLALIEIKISDLLMWRQQVEELTPKGLVQKVLNPYIVNDCGDHVRKKVADHVDVKVEGYVSVVCSIRKGFHVSVDPRKRELVKRWRYQDGKEEILGLDEFQSDLGEFPVRGTTPLRRSPGVLVWYTHV